MSFAMQWQLLVRQGLFCYQLVLCVLLLLTKELRHHARLCSTTKAQVACITDACKGHGPSFDSCGVGQNVRSTGSRQNAHPNRGLAVPCTRPPGDAAPKPHCCSAGPAWPFAQKEPAGSTRCKAKAEQETGSQIERCAEVFVEESRV